MVPCIRPPHNHITLKKYCVKNSTAFSNTLISSQHQQAHGRPIISRVEMSHVNPRFHTMLALWNLELTGKIPTAIFSDFGATCASNDVFTTSTKCPLEKDTHHGTSSVCNIYQHQAEKTIENVIDPRSMLRNSQMRAFAAYKYSLGLFTRILEPGCKERNLHKGVILRSCSLRLKIKKIELN